MKKQNLDELKALRMPPEPIHDVLNAVLRLFGNMGKKYLNKHTYNPNPLDTSWNAMKKFLSQKGIIDSILNFDARTITRDIRKDLENFINEKNYSF